MGRSFRDLTVWERAVDLSVCVYEVTSEFPKPEMYGLVSQMRRAAVSVASNIAEGAARSSKKEFRQFLSVARGSNCELQTQLVIAARLRMAGAQRLSKAEALSHQVGRMLNGLVQSIEPSLRTDN